MTLAELSVRRGSDSFGCAYSSLNHSHITYSKKDIKRVFNQKNYQLESPAILLSHARLATNSVSAKQPFVRHEALCAHNGIIINHKKSRANSAPLMS